MIRDAFGLQTAIVACAEPVIDRSLDATRYEQATGYRAPSWAEMIDELAEDWRAHGGGRSLSAAA
ncbi:MAG: hypothetical protein AAFW98_12915, partial [Pseudomonadota bacterium]